MTQQLTITADKELNFKIRRSFELFRTRVRILTNWVATGACDIAPELIVEEFLEYEKNCDDFIQGLVAVYNSEAPTPLNTGAESLSYDVDFNSGRYFLTPTASPFITRQFALNTIENALIIRELQRLLG